MSRRSTECAALLVAVVASACVERVSVAPADCPGVLSVSDVACEGACHVDGEATVFAQDSQACRFVRWEGSCGESPLCRAADTGGRAHFERIAWPLTVDVSAAPAFTATVSPGGVRCDATCEVWLAVGTDFSVRAVGPVGQKPAFAGDCASVGDTCSGVANRARTVSVRTQTDEVSLRLVASGDGVVTLDSPAATCAANETCVVQVVRGETVTARATANMRQQLQGWSRSECSGATCSFRVTQPDELVATFVPTRRLQLSQAGGVGGVRINGVSRSLPVDEALVRGAVVELVAAPAPDDVLLRFEGLPCESPRVIDECRFALLEDVSGLVRFHRLFQWAIGGSSTEFAGFAVRPEGVLAAVTNSQDINVGAPGFRTGEGLYLVHEDAGMTLVRQGSVRDTAGLLVGAQDKLWMFAQPRALPGETSMPVWWGGFDAGVAVRRTGAGHPIFLGLDDQLGVDVMQTLSLSASDGNPDVVEWGSVIVRESSIFSPMWWVGEYDGGVSPSGVAKWSSGFELQSFVVQPSRLKDLAVVAGAMFSVSAAPVDGHFSAGCVVSPGFLGVVARLNEAGECVQLAGTNSLDGGWLSGRAAIARGSSAYVHALESERYALRMTAWTQGLQFMHSKAIVWSPWRVQDGASPTQVPLVMGEYVFGSVDIRHSEPIEVLVAEVRVRCPGTETSRLLFRQRTVDGAVDWATCLVGKQGAVERFGGFEYTGENAVRAFGGVLMAETAREAGDTGATFNVGSSVVPSKGARSLYFMLLTPPLEP